MHVCSRNPSSKIQSHIISAILDVVKDEGKAKHLGTFVALSLLALTTHDR